MRNGDVTVDSAQDDIDRFQADLHIHTLLSPCAEVEMIPSLILAAAQMAGLDLIGITDHNSCENAGAVIKAAEGTGLRVIPGLEVMSVEGIHLICLFNELAQALEMQEAVYESLPNIPGADKLIEQQLIVDEIDEFKGYCEKPISLPTLMDIYEISKRTSQLKGICIPSHIDRQSTGLCGILGMLPEEPDFDAVEISGNISRHQARQKHPSIGNRAIFQNSDAHWLSAIGERRTVLYMQHRNVAEIKLACKCEGGRRVEDA